MDRPEKPSTIKKRRSLLFRISKWWIPKFFYFASFVFFGTARTRYFNKGHFDDLIENNKSMIVACFHQGILFLPFLLRHNIYGKRIAMVSTSPEGDYIADAMKMFGQSAARGSSTRGGKKALQIMIDMINERQSIAHHGLITVDGPKGPAFDVKMGVVKLAKETGLPIVPIHWCASPSIKMPNWDQTMLPLPFSKLTIAYGKPIFISENASSEEMEEVRQKVTQSLQNCKNITHESLNIRDSNKS